MVDKISKQQAYLNAVMAKLPDVKNKEIHTVKKGETLWSLAKKNLNKKKHQVLLLEYLLFLYLLPDFLLNQTGLIHAAVFYTA